MSFRPARKSVAAVARMMKYITTFEKAMPVKTSWRASRSSWSLAPRRSATVRRPLARSSSTSCEACQKNRYGEIVRHARQHLRGVRHAGEIGGDVEDVRREQQQAGAVQEPARIVAARGAG